MQGSHSIDQQVLETVNSAPKMEIYYFLRDNEGFYSAKKIASSLDRHRTNVTNHLNAMFDECVVVCRENSGTRYWDLNDGIHDALEEEKTTTVQTFQLDGDPEYEYSVGEIPEISLIVDKPNPDSVPEDLADHYALVGPLIWLVVVGSLMIMTGEVDVVPDVYPSLGLAILSGGAVGLLTLGAAAFKEVHYD